MAKASRTGSAAVRSTRRCGRFGVNSRRRQVLDAAVTVMQHTGFHQMSMQALADEAKVSVGLIYKYFGGKEDILLATIVDILHAFRDQLAPAMESAGDDPVARLSAMFRRYVEIVDENRDAVVLTYRESRTLDAQGREKIKELEGRDVAAAAGRADGGDRRRCVPRRRRGPGGVRSADHRARLGAQAVALRAGVRRGAVHRGADGPDVAGAAGAVVTSCIARSDP